MKTSHIFLIGCGVVLVVYLLGKSKKTADTSFDIGRDLGSRGVKMSS